jgi:hypothetical protein
MAIVVTMACGCRVESDGIAAPVCATHHETRVQHVQARPPKFRGAVRGPCAVALVLALSLAVGPSLQAQTCTLTRVEAAPWGALGQKTVPLSKALPGGDPTGFVPDGEVWLIKAAGGAINNNTTPIEWSLAIEHHMADGACCILVPLRKPLGVTADTPVIALDRPVILEPGERLQLRSNSLPGDRQMALLYIGWRMPLACLPRLINVAAGAGTTTPDFDALIQATHAFVTALEETR